jgi:uncharacterized coiled-coil protein SlyX
MADANYTAKITVDVDSMRKSVESGLQNIKFGLSDKSASAIGSKLEKQLKPNISFNTNRESIRDLRTKIAQGLGQVPISLKVDQAGVARQVKNAIAESVTIKLNLSAGAKQFQKLNKLTGDAAAQFDKISEAKDRFAANVEQKFPRIQAHVRSLTEELVKLKGQMQDSSNFRAIKVPKPPTSQAGTPGVAASDTSKEVDNLSASQDKLSRQTKKPTPILKPITTSLRGLQRLLRGLPKELDILVKD